MEMTQMVLGLARRYRDAGMAHPVAAATTVAARGATGMERRSFAEGHGIDEDLLEECEAGRVPFAALPEVVGALVEGSGRVCLLQLADLDREVRRQERRVESFRRTAFAWAFDQPVESYLDDLTGDGDRLDEFAARRRSSATIRRVWGSLESPHLAAHRMIYELLYSEPSEMS